MELWFFSLHIVRWWCIFDQRLIKNFLDSIKVIEFFIGKISKEHNSVKHVGGVTVLVLCTSSDDGLYLYNVS